MTRITTWFITGASSGFGSAFAEYAIASGYNVVATARTSAKLADLGVVGGDRFLAIDLDVTSPETIQPAVDAAVERFGGLDVVINNAGYSMIGAVEETSDAAFRAIMDTNLFGAAAVTRAVLPIMRRQGSGAIVNMSSLCGQVSFVGTGAYSASKFALEGLSEALAGEVAPFGIKVLLVEPGNFRTNIAAKANYVPEIDAYSGSAGAVRRMFSDMHQTQPGDPAKAAAAIDAALKADRTPLRLQLGGDAIDGVRAHAEALLAELAVWEDVGRATDFD